MKETRTIRTPPKSAFIRLIAVLCIAVLALCSGCATTTSVKPTAAAQESGQSIEGAWGIKVTSLRLTAGGNLLDFRYRVTDPLKASSLLKEKMNKPYLIDLATGARLSIPELPKIGAMRTSTKNLVANKDNFMMFANPGMLLKQGSKVTVVIGDFKAENLTVE